MTRAYLTIDDSPSLRMDDLVDFLAVRDIPALFFVRGDALERSPEPVIRALRKGFSVGNHTYAHKRASERPFEETKADILKCEALIEKAHTSAGVRRNHKTFRFSYLDRGTGAWVVDFDRLTPEQRRAMEPVFQEGLNFCDRKKPGPEAFEKKAALQDFLKSEGFAAPFQGVTLDWYAHTEVAQARDCFFTYSTSDWMLTRRHLEKNWPYRDLEALRRRIGEDEGLKKKESVHVILAHDQEEIFDPVCGLVEHFSAQGFEFLDF